MKNKSIAILGSTGSIGVQAIEAIELYPDEFEIEVLAANSNVKLLIEQAKKYQPNVVVVAQDEEYDEVFDALDPLEIKIYAGSASISQVVSMDSIDIVLNAISGFHGVLPSIAALESGKTLALANKESLVAAGHILKKLEKDNGGVILPVDSEPSAILQCLNGEQHNKIEKVILTASGGPFKDLSPGELPKVTPEEALNHPVWQMGRGVTIDSATLINKGWEMIEVMWLFDLKPHQIDIVIHPEAIIHSMVQFEDGCTIAQLGLTDMKIPLLYALNYPFRKPYGNKRIDFLALKKLSFQGPDLEKFPCLQLAIEAMKKGGCAPTALLGANETAVDAFLNGKISFTDIALINQKCLYAIEQINDPKIDVVIEVYDSSVKLANELINKAANTPA